MVEEAKESSFRKVMVWSTGLGLAALFGSMAALRPGDGRWLQFGWNWMILVWAVAAWLLNGRWWAAVLEMQDRPNPESRKRLLRYSVLLGLLGLAAFLYPIRFAAGEHYRALTEGLIKAVAALSFVGWMLYRTGRLLVAQDAAAERKYAKR